MTLLEPRKLLEFRRLALDSSRSVRLVPRPYFLAFLALVVAGWSTLADAQSWVAVGPPGGDVRALASDPRNPQRIYLGTGAGVLYRSDDAGLRWQRLSPGFPLRGRSLDEISVDRGGVVLVGYWEVQGSGGGV